MTFRSQPSAIRTRRIRRRGLLGWTLLLAIPLLLLGWLGYQGVYRSRQAARETAAPKAQAQLTARLALFTTDFARGDDARSLTADERLEMLIVEAGARLDLGEADKAVVTLQAADLAPGQTGPAPAPAIWPSLS